MKKILATLNRKWAEYLLEIFVIMMGILGAFSLNNWNESKSRLKDEISILEDIKQGLQADLKDGQGNRKYYKISNNSLGTILAVFEKDLPYHDSLSTHFGATLLKLFFMTHEGNYDALKAKGFDILSNRELKNKIIRIYDYRYQAIVELQSGVYINNQKLADYCIYHFDKVYALGKMVPLDYESLKRDVVYRTLLKSRLENCLYMLGWYDRMIEEVEILITDIDEEIIQLSE